MQKLTPLQNRKRLNLLRNTAVALIVCMVPTIAAASSWSPTLLVNTEAFQSIDDGDGSSDIELRFGTTGQELRWNVTDSQFEFDAGLEVHGTLSGTVIHAQDLLTASGGLVVEGAVTFGSTFTIGGITYTFPTSDASASGRVLASDGSGNLSWTAAGSTPNVFQTVSVSGQSDVVSDQESDTLTFAAGSNVTITTTAGSDTITIAADGPEAGQGITVDGTTVSLNSAITGSSLEIYGTASGQIVHAQDRLTSSGAFAVDGQGFFNGNTTIGDAAGDTLTINSQTLNWVNPISGTDNSVLVLNSSNNIVADEIDSKVWQGSLVDGSGTTNRLVKWSDSDSLTDGGISDGSDELAITIDSNEQVGIGTSSPEAELDVAGTISGSQLQINGNAAIEGTVTVGGLTSCTNIETDSNGVISCNNTDYIEETELDSESELESQLTDVTNVLTNNDDTDDLSEGSSNLYFTNERVDDRINALFQAGSGITLTYDDSGGTFTVQQAISSGAQVSLSPEYAGAVYYGDGSNNVGQMTLSYDATNKENYYKWTSTQSSLQDYSIAVRAKVPEDFDHWDGTAPIQFRYRSNAASSDDNQIDVTMLDTAGSSVSLTSGADLANTSWTTATITGPESTGTYTPGSYITIIITMQARTTNSGEAHAGFLNINWHTEP